MEGIDRREWISRILQIALGAGVAGHAIGAETWTPQVLTEEQNAALVTLGERIIPGSAAAMCNRVIDLVLTMESDKKRAQLVDSLAVFDPKGGDEMLAAAAQSDGKIHAQFQVIKEWMADVYWSSEPGLRELGWTGRLAWPGLPGCEHSQSHSAG